MNQGHLAELQERATPRPWRVGFRGYDIRGGEEDDKYIIAAAPAGVLQGMPERIERWIDDAALIVAVVNALPVLLDGVKDSQEARDQLFAVTEALGKLTPEAVPHVVGWARKVKQERDEAGVNLTVSLELVTRLTRERNEAQASEAAMRAALEATPPHNCNAVRHSCCNPACSGQWGTGCYCCHHGKYHPALATDASKALAERVQKLEALAEAVKAYREDGHSCRASGKLCRLCRAHEALGAP